ncbi:FAD-dependent oxidoreductase [Arthrobacter ramosus]|uniref:FAD-dependent oxidoreductase n=1 Tax=Arthrobacter ramosus TaxID=1672 RepID=A0ABV5Y4L2_ARTRM|nr:cyclic nucleotide-binding domain-containing thioredoxin-disulfide reductase [Arthrobacter ramosus]
MPKKGPADANTSAAYPVLSAEQIRRLRSYAVVQDVAVGDTVFRAGDETYDLIVIERGTVDLIRGATHDAPEEVVVSHGPGRFIGELGLLTGQSVYLTGLVVQAGRIHRIPQTQFRRLMAEDAELSDILLLAFLARRELLRNNAAARVIEIVGSRLSASSLELRTFAARLRLTHLWFEADSVAGQALMRAAAVEAGDLPVVITPDKVMRRATAEVMAHELGLSYRRAVDQKVDLAVIGAGPAGLAAAVYGASEGLATVLLDMVGPGGQAAASSRIENYLGFPTGISGTDLTGKAIVQALKFGAQLSAPCGVTALDVDTGMIRLSLTDGTSVESRAVIIATGARYRSLPLTHWEKFQGAGIYYAATELEAKWCAGQPVTVVGGANSAGQASLYLASRGNAVNLVVRGAHLAANMSSYLIDRLTAEPLVSVHTATEVSGLHGQTHLDAVELTDRESGIRTVVECAGLFCFIGEVPATTWLKGLALDNEGFILTDSDLDPSELGGSWSALGRRPLPFETSIPGVFAAGDVRKGSMKRVAAAVGEGASAVQSVHASIGFHD